MPEHEYQLNTRCLELSQSFFDKPAPDALVLVRGVHSQRRQNDRRDGPRGILYTHGRKQNVTDDLTIGGCNQR